MKIKKVVCLLIFCLSDTAAFAFYTHHNALSLGAVSHDLMGPINLLRYSFNAASFVLGAAMLFSAFNRYLRYRQNPQESPLSTVIVWALIGLIFIAIPLAHYLAVEAAQKTGVANVVV